MDLIISSPTENRKYSNLKKITIPSVSGQLQILEGYAETFVLLEPDVIFFENHDGFKKSHELYSGAQCYIKNDVITVVI